MQTRCDIRIKDEAIICTIKELLREIQIRVPPVI